MNIDIHCEVERNNHFPLIASPLKNSNTNLQAAYKKI